MTKKTVFFLLSLILALGLTACNKDGNQDAQKAPADQATAQNPAPAAPSGWTGKIVETMNSGGYTYINLDTGKEKIWAAAPETKVEVGQRVSVPRGMMMKDFPSTTLNKTFDEIWFVNGFYPEGQMPKSLMAAKPSGGMPGALGDGSAGAMGASHNKVADAGVSGVDKVDGGYDIAGIYAAGASLAGQKVKVRGRVVKVTPRVMGTNWIHIQDGSGSGATADLAVTSSAEVQTGDLIVVEGTLATDKDFGAGYKYSAIIENATVTKE